MFCAILPFMLARDNNTSDQPISVQVGWQSSEHLVIRCVYWPPTRYASCNSRPLPPAQPTLLSSLCSSRPISSIWRRMGQVVRARMVKLSPTSASHPADTFIPCHIQRERRRLETGKSNIRECVSGFAKLVVIKVTKGP